MECGCIYNPEAHPECDRTNASMLVDLLPGYRTQVVEMCVWCANNWKERHPHIEIMSVE